MADVLTDARLDSPARVIEILRQKQAALEAAFVSSGHAFAGRRLAATATAGGFLSEVTSGVSYYDSLIDTLEEAQQNWPILLARLETIRRKLLCREGLVVNLCADGATLDGLDRAGATERFVARIPATSKDGYPASAACDAWDHSRRLPAVNEGFAVTTQVNYVGLAAPLYAPGESIDGGVSVVSRLLSRGFLWDQVRVTGGAYGGGCSFSSSSGRLGFSSYRDPNLAATLDVYARVAGAAAELAESISEEALHQAVIGTIGDMDSPQSSDQRSFTSLARHLTGVTTADRQAWRDDVLSTDRGTFQDFADRLHKSLSPAGLGEGATACVFASKAALEDANQTFDLASRLKLTELG